MKMRQRTRAWIFSPLTFLFCLQPAFFIGITLSGRARLLPYVSVWLDRLVFVTTALWLPLLAAFGSYPPTALPMRSWRSSLSSSLEGPRL